MEKGRIVYLNGVTSAGKTSIVEALQARRDVFFSAGIQYSLRVDTSKQSPDECAGAILNALF